VVKRQIKDQIDNNTDGDAKKRREKSTVQSLERSLDILEVLAQDGPHVAIVDLAHRTGLHVSTVHRLLSTLLGRGYVQQDAATNKYSLGLRALQLAAGASLFADFRSLAKPHLQDLMELTGETANLVVLAEDEAVYIEQVEGPRLVRMFTKIGRLVPLHCTGVGKVFLSAMTEQQVDRLITRKGLPAFTERTIIDPDALKAELERIRTQGFALDNEEQEEGVRCIAAPVYRGDWEIVAAISVSAPVTRLSEERALALAPKVREAGLALSEKLGLRVKLTR
jgi:IclR family acetate operon transcriptional repressor